MSTLTPPKLYMTWDELGVGARDLARQIVESGWRPDTILLPTRGGLLVGGAVLYAFELLEGVVWTRNIHVINVELYTAEETTLPEPRFHPPGLNYEHIHPRILIIDDVADSGETIEGIIEEVREKLPEAEIEVAVLHEKARSKICARFAWARNVTGWVCYPWSTPAEELARATQ